MAFAAKDELATLNFEQLDTEFETIANRIEIAREELADAEQATGYLDDSRSALAEATIRLDKARLELDEVKADRIRVETELAQLDEAETRLKEILVDYNAASQDHAVYSVLTDAFHRNGIPTMILQRGLPIIEQEANRVLARMPQNMQIGLVTQRETKAKTTKETLDVVVSNGGVDYEYASLSGGERFRIDFALRLGISAVLSQRAGTPVDMLWLDEGWGTQDPEGHEAMFEAISAVSERFGLIVLITHLPEITDRMPARIEVAKEAGVAHARLVD